MMEHKVWGIEGVRKQIFSYLRTKPYSSCHTCGLVLQWNPCDKLKVSTISYYGIQQCSPCYKEDNIENTLFMSEYL